MANITTQARSTVGRNQAGRDVNEITNYNYSDVTLTQVNTLLESLGNEINNDEKLHERLEDFSEYIDKRSKAKIVGLDKKIEKTKFNISLNKAIEKKEIFYKLMTKYSEFYSAQLLFVYFFSCIQDVFDEKIEPKIDELNIDEYNDIVDKYIIDAIINEIGGGTKLMIINKNHIRGMIYFLADRCFVQWH